MPVLWQAAEQAKKQAADLTNTRAQLDTATASLEQAVKVTPNSVQHAANTHAHLFLNSIVRQLEQVITLLYLSKQVTLWL